MQTIFNFNSDRDSILESAGIFPLTGEACNYSMRTLCDVNDNGREMLKNFFGMTDISLPSNWNSQGNGSVMLPGSLFTDLICFILLETCERVYIDENNDVYACENASDMEQIEKAVDNGFFRSKRIFRKLNHPRDGSRNIHVMSGRTL